MPVWINIDQSASVMGGVNDAPNYIDTVDIGTNGTVTNTTHQGGIVSIYYLGAIFGAFAGGVYIPSWLLLKKNLLTECSGLLTELAVSMASFSLQCLLWWAEHFKLLPRVPTSFSWRVL